MIVRVSIPSIRDALPIYFFGSGAGSSLTNGQYQCSHRITACTSFQGSGISTGLGVALSIPAIRQLGRTHFFGSGAGSSLTNGQYQCSHRITACTSFQGSGISTGLGVALSIPAIRQLGRTHFFGSGAGSSLTTLHYARRL